MAITIRVSYTLRVLYLLVFCALSAFNAGAQASHPLSTPNAPDQGKRYNPFPSLYFIEPTSIPALEQWGHLALALPEIEAAAQGWAVPSWEPSILLNNDILAFYGHPLSARMGILGRYSIQEADRLLSALADEYRAANGGRGVIKAFHIIYGTVWPEGEIGILKESTLLDYIQYALERDILVFIDHQIGRYDPVSALRRMLPYLAYPNVHLALDPEWRTTRPMREIGTISAEEINEAQRVMEAYLIEQDIPGERLLLIHQFNWRMISSRERVLSTFERVRLIHCADGFGSPAIKRESYLYNAQAANMPIKGFKLFYRNASMPEAGYDYPLLTPQEVYELNPRPYLIMYQ